LREHTRHAMLPGSFMETILLAIQARVLLWVGLGYVAVGLWLGTDPATLAWRAPLAAVGAMIVAGWLLRQVTTVVEERVATELAERQLAAEQAAAKAEPPAMQALHAAQARQKARG
jgi:hypothetical protein